MKKWIGFIGCLTFLSICFGCVPRNMQINGKELETGFVAPPDSIQTSVYWYWISGHISEEGVVNDLKSMKAAGINRAFIGNIGLEEKESGKGKVAFNSDEWWKILHTALKTATELNIKIGIFNSPGWSQSGGPWVKPNQAMRYLASSSVTVSGGKQVELDLPAPGADFQDVKTIAFPSIPGGSNLYKNIFKIHSSQSVKELLHLCDDDLATETVFPALKENKLTLDFESKDPFTLRSLKIYPTRVPIRANAKLQVKKDDNFETLDSFLIDRFNFALNVGFQPDAPIVISVPETKASDFRLLLTDVAPNSGFREVEWSSVPYVERYPEKTLAKMFQTPLPYWNEYQWRDQPEVTNDSLVIDPDKVIDLTARVTGGHLSWNAPAGEWTILRMGMRPTGVTNSPAAPEATGLEIDKMSKEHVESHFEAFLGEIIRRIPAEDRACWEVVVQDSYETGGQNFTDDFLESFTERYGYDPIPFLPVYDGFVVQSEELSDRFLWDMRRLVADRIAYDYVGGLRDVSHKYGLHTWLENYGHWGFPGEFLQYGGQSDEIGGEFWSEGELGNIENRAASSCGHIYGKNKISAESFTAGGNTFGRYPQMMKQRGDRFFTEGINNTLLHVYISQPYEEKEPGVNAWFGNEFNRKNTWFPQLDLFTTYVKRVNFMLQQGLNVADVAYFIGEDTPKMTGITDPPLPKGYQFDYINAEVIERDLFVKNGLLTLPHGTQYKLLVLPALETMRPELLTKIKDLIEAGGVVLGPPPSRSPSMQNYPRADEEVQRLVKLLWSKLDGTTVKSVKIGKGMLLRGMNLSEALALVNCVPDCKLAAEDPILYGHRDGGKIQIYFLSNQSEKPITFTPEFRVKSMQPEVWDATTGKVRPLPSFEQTQEGTVVPMKLDALESAFVVFRTALKDMGNLSAQADAELNFPTPQVLKELSGPWTLTFDTARRGPAEPLLMDKLVAITESKDFDIRHYSGSIVYNSSFDLDSLPDKRLYLDLHELYAMAKVKVNGEYAGGVWTTPYRLDITERVKKGVNNLEIEVVTTWRNRLVGDQQLPEKDRKTWLPANPWKADSPLQKMGLIGPVTLETQTY
ncbi:glycosyl hydrolase [Parabacteroides sp. Marseille-P3160]|uniref:glycosyl hydrolase n=1 Tax=Parabacteroides sp. Marseille-P3160 TaxID=1917887 RepID=UPI0009BB5512